MDKITLSKMEFEGHTGCLDFEKTDGQKFIVSLDLFIDRIRGCYTDDLSDTVDYAKIYEVTKTIVTEDKGDLIECLAQKISDGVLKADSRIDKVAVTVSKPGAPVKGIFETMEVTIERSRKEFVILSIGSNLGDREANILAAEDAVKALPGVEDIRYASIYETEPVGLEDQPYFLNTCIGFYTDIGPYDLLEKIHVIENGLLRTREVHWGPRTIDIDIIFYGNRVIMTPELTVPHPRWHLRSFVTVPLREIKEIGPEHPDDKEVSLYRKRG
ncbi:MAG: 2-amino-4-hydroxy-6-hydroxymethyldihydropteridine diphosphokinase [Clostridiales bacterium]|nr:2-amino-4-hydroxy-6-hydroxymethyldihydropteridine diphosphokinase [Clostridiales bacterium]